MPSNSLVGVEGAKASHTLDPENISCPLQKTKGEYKMKKKTVQRSCHNSQEPQLAMCYLNFHLQSSPSTTGDV